MKKKINAEDVYLPSQLFSHAIAATGVMICSSGFLARDPLTGNILFPGDPQKQTERCLDNIQRVLRAAGGGLDSIVKMTVFLRNAEDYEAMNTARRHKLAGCEYASSTVIAGLVATDALVEIEVTAIVDRIDDGRRA